MLMEVNERHRLMSHGSRNASPAGALHPATSFGGRRLFFMSHNYFTSIIVEGTHSLILQHR